MNKDYRIGFTTGVFDMFHIGHLNLLERCKQQCAYLIVAVCDDNYVRMIKQKEPIIPLHDRMRILGALKCVDEVVSIGIDEVEDKMKALEKYRFDVLFSGDDWKGTERYKKTEEQFAKNNATIVYLPYTQGISTTSLKERINKK